ncbi:MAG TPA: DUF3775 domain-containing protein [Thermohalobaculum sp.]|nr:DUF3775 domain-containing protein [Thermohalobaculum sp.]
MLSIPLNTVGWIIIKAREFGVKDVDTGDGGDIDSGDPMGVLEDRGDDPTFGELTSWIEDLTDSQKAELVALFWLGRDDGDASEFPDLVDEARGQQGKGSTARYLLGSPLLGDYLEEGLERLGIDTSELESDLR